MVRWMENIPRILFYVCLVCVAFILGAIAHREDIPPIPQLESVESTLFSVAESTDNARHHLQPARGQGDGVTVNAGAGADTLVFMVGFFDGENQLRLVTRDGTVFRKWSADYLEHFPDREERVCDVLSPLLVDMHGAHITSRGEVVFNYDYCGTVKLDHCGNVVWKLAERTHHSLVPAEAGGYWSLGQWRWRTDEAPDRFPPFSNAPEPMTIEEDTLLRIGEDGAVLEEVSIPQIMRDNGLEALLTATGGKFSATSDIRHEIVHANKLAELPSGIADAYPLFKAGDLAISMRRLNLVMVIDPASKQVKWHQTGPWLRQHDPEFRPDGRISIFNNNGYLHGYLEDQTDLKAPRKSNIMIVDPVTGDTEIAFGGEPGEEMLSVVRGQHEILADNAMLITEFDAGRVFEVNADRDIVWEYVNAHNEDFVGEVTNSAVVPRSYFQVDWNACDND